MASCFWKNWIAVCLILQACRCQQSPSGLGEFVKQLTSFISQNGGIASLVNAIPHGPNDEGYPPPGRYPEQYPTRYPDYPEYAPQYQDGYYDRPPRPPYRPGYPQRPGYHQRPGYAPGYPDYRPDYPGYPQDYPPGPPALPPGYYGPDSGYPQQSLMAALGSIARHDDLRCVPRLLCEVTAGGRPGQPSYLSSAQQTTKDAITSLLTVLNFVDDNPLFIFGRAALLGAASRGNSAACLNAYPTCPRDPDRLVYYLNNHKGGFFRFFGGLPGQQKGLDGDTSAAAEDGEARIQNRPFQPYSGFTSSSSESSGFVFSDKPTREPHSSNFFRPAEAQDYLPSSAHDDTFSSSDRIVFPSADRAPGRGGKQLQFPEDSSRPSYSYGSAYRPDYNPPQDLVNFRDQRAAVKFPSRMSFPHL